MEALASLSVWERHALQNNEMAAFRCSPVPFVDDDLDEIDDDVTGIDDDNNSSDEDDDESELDVGNVVRDLPSILQENGTQCIQNIIPRVKELLCVAEAELHLTACSTLLHILQQSLVPVQKYSDTFLHIILNNLDSKDSGKSKADKLQQIIMSHCIKEGKAEIAAAWLSTLLDVIDLLPKDIINREVLSVAVQKGQLSDNVRARMACCQLLGKLASQLDISVLRTDVLPLVQSLCLDVDCDVRACMCHHLPLIVKALGEAELMKTSLLMELVELASDEEERVRKVALETVVSISKMLDPSSLRETIVPLVIRCCQQAVNHQDRTLPLVSSHIADVYLCLKDVLTVDETRWLFDLYKTLCLQGLSLDLDIECRTEASVHFYEMLSVASFHGWQQELIPVMTAMCCDPAVSVRRNIASQLYEILDMQVCERYTALRLLCTLLYDQNVEVLAAVINHLSDSLLLIVTECKAELNSEQLCELASAIVRCKSTLFSCSRHWRLQQEFAICCCKLPLVFTSQQIREMFASQLVNDLLHARALPVRHQLVISMLTLLYSCTDLDFQNNIVNKLIIDLAQSSSCFRRQLFVTVCKEAQVIFGEDFVVHNFLPAAIILLRDPVSNVRLVTVRVLPSLKKMLLKKVPGNSQMVTTLKNTIVERQQEEHDRDVLELLNKAIHEMELEVAEELQVGQNKEVLAPQATHSHSGEYFNDQEHALNDKSEKSCVFDMNIKLTRALQSHVPRSQLPRKGKERKEPNAMKNNSEYESDVTNNLELQNVSATISAEGHTSAIITNLSACKSKKQGRPVQRRSTLPIFTSSKAIAYTFAPNKKSISGLPSSVSCANNITSGLPTTSNCNSSNISGLPTTSNSNNNIAASLTTTSNSNSSNIYGSTTTINTKTSILSSLNGGRPASGTPIPPRKTSQIKSSQCQLNNEPANNNKDSVKYRHRSSSCASSKLPQPNQNGVGMTRLPLPVFASPRSRSPSPASLKNINSATSLGLKSIAPVTGGTSASVSNTTTLSSSSSTSLLPTSLCSISTSSTCPVTAVSLTSNRLSLITSISLSSNRLSLPTPLSSITSTSTCNVTVLSTSSNRSSLPTPLSSIPVPALLNSISQPITSSKSAMPIHSKATSSLSHK